MLRFPYLSEKLLGPPSPAFPGAKVKFRPLVPLTIRGLGGAWQFSRALLDSGADDSVFPLGTASHLGAIFRPDTGQRVRWRGQLYPLRFGDVELLLTDNIASYRWPALVAFSPAPLAYPLLGYGGCLQFFDVRFRGDDRVVEIESNHAFPGHP
ncbi:MAG: hypothetical protein JO112_00080 [Planctomycetes bacterium]|nr:hypothetical protein [Planctomycetota bacterium]